MEQNDRQRNILKQFSQFVENEIYPHTQDFENKQELPGNLIKQMAQAGYLAASVPAKFSGLDLNPFNYGLFTEIIGKACPALRTLITVHTSLVLESIIRFGNPGQIEKYAVSLARGHKIGAFALTEPDTGSDAKNIAANFQETNDGFVISGEKKWISYGQLADVFLVFAQKEGVISAFVIDRDTEGLQVTPMEGVMAGRATYLAELEFNNAFIPKDQLLGRKGSGFTYVMTFALDNGRYSIAWAGVAIAGEALRLMCDYAKKRKQFDLPIYNHQLIKGMIADSTVKTEAARELCKKAGQLRNQKNTHSIQETIIAKYFASKVAVEVTSNALQVFGANGISNKYPVEMLFREAKILEIIEGTSQIQQILISKYAMKKHSKRNLLANELL